MTKEQLEQFLDAMESVKAVLDGQLKKPGGADCRFPHCSCNSPWEKCEREG